jgi:hypothetical protein
MRARVRNDTSWRGSVAELAKAGVAGAVRGPVALGVRACVGGWQRSEAPRKEPTACMQAWLCRGCCNHHASFCDRRIQAYTSEPPIPRAAHTRAAPWPRICGRLNPARRAARAKHARTHVILHAGAGSLQHEARSRGGHHPVTNVRRRDALAAHLQRHLEAHLRVERRTCRESSGY